MVVFNWYQYMLVMGSRSIPANTVRIITFVEVPFSSLMDERNEDVPRT